nr:MAG TPA: hypothetical protein [Caudoviricetes sp.]
MSIKNFITYIVLVVNYLTSKDKYLFIHFQDYQKQPFSVSKFVYQYVHKRLFFHCTQKVLTDIGCKSLCK